MNIFTRVLSMMFVASIISSCGGGGNEVSSGGNSGFGGTGISFVRGNIASVDGQTLADTKARSAPIQLLANLLIDPALAQAIDSGALRVSGGGKSSGVDSGGRFELSDVESSENLILVFSFNSRRVATLPIGAVSNGAIINVSNVRIDTASGDASSEGIEKKVPELSGADDDSEDDASDDDDVSDDSDSEDNDSDDDSADDSDDDSEDQI